MTESNKLVPVSTSTLVVTPLDQVHHKDADEAATPACLGSPVSVVANLLLLMYKAPAGGTLIASTKLSFAGSGMMSYWIKFVLVSLPGAEITKLIVIELMLVGTLYKAE